MSNCTHTDKTNLQTILMCRRIQNGIIYRFPCPGGRKHPWHNPDLISSRDKLEPLPPFWLTPFPSQKWRHLWTAPNLTWVLSSLKSQRQLNDYVSVLLITKIASMNQPFKVALCYRREGGNFLLKKGPSWHVSLASQKNVMKQTALCRAWIFNININLFEHFYVKHSMFNVNVNYFFQKDPQCQYQCQCFSDLNVNVNVNVESW